MIEMHAICKSIIKHIYYSDCGIYFHELNGLIAVRILEFDACVSVWSVSIFRISNGSLERNITVP